MKKYILILLVFIAASFVVYSCKDKDNDNGNQNKTRAQLEEETKGFLARRWELGEEYLDLNLEGTFEASLNGKHSKGKWGLSYETDDKKTLKLIGEEDESAETNDFQQSYELINVSYDRLVAIDPKGNKINFYPEE